MRGLPAVSFADTVSNRAMIVSPVSRSRSVVRNFVVSGAPSALAARTAYSSRTRCAGIRTSIESASTLWESEVARARPLPQAMARWSRSSVTRRSIVSDRRTRSSLVAMAEFLASTRSSFFRRDRRSIVSPTSVKVRPLVPVIRGVRMMRRSPLPLLA